MKKTIQTALCCIPVHTKNVFISVSCGQVLRQEISCGSLTARSHIAQAKQQAEVFMFFRIHDTISSYGCANTGKGYDLAKNNFPLDVQNKW